MAAVPLKDTLLLPVTDFPMRAQLGVREPKQLLAWQQQNVWQQICASRAGKKPFVLHDGPPYANGALHHGHILNKILKDIIVKDRTMAGMRPVYRPGWDCHGLPIETQVDKDLGAKKRGMSNAERMGHCRAWAHRFVASQAEGFARLGVFAKWEDPYLTMAPSYQAQIVRAFADMYDTDLVFRGLRPVHWCTRHQTALAEAEVEYDDKKSASLTVALAVADGAEKDSNYPTSFRALAEPLALAIWTTTPWSLPGNVAVVVHPELVYVAVPLGDRHVVVAEPCYAHLCKAVAARGVAAPLPAECAAAWPRATGAELVGLTYVRPMGTEVGVVLADAYVSTETGTGLVHAAPAHGVDDFAVTTRAGLDVLSLVDATGHFTSEAGEVSGLSLKDGGARVIALLDATGALLSAPSASIVHRYAHCWRCHEPIITRATEQWFLAMDKPFANGPSLRERALASLDEVEWVPSWGVERIRGMLANRPDWCLSRQRRWGVTLPIAYCVACHEPHADAAAMRKAADFVQQHDAAAMAEVPLAELFGGQPTCKRCGSQELRLGQDILDVWFDSGVSWRAATDAGMADGEPADMYLEGSDQHRGWFHSSLLTSLVLQQKAPFRRCLTHGFVVDGNGKKLSKSKGNFTDPFKSIARDGAELWRLWVASEDYQQDVRVSPAIMAQLSDHYRKLRNTIRYLLGNLHDFVPGSQLVQPAALQPFDAWAIGEVTACGQEVTALFAACSFHQGMQKLTEFCQGTLSAFYLDALKDRLYADEKDSSARKSAQSALWLIVRDLLRLLAPVLCFTAEEAWALVPAFTSAKQTMASEDAPNVAAAKLQPALAEAIDTGTNAAATAPPSSVHLAYYPGAGAEPAEVLELRQAGVAYATAHAAVWQLVRQVRRQVTVLLEGMRRQKELGSSTEAAVALTFGADELLLANALSAQAWGEILIVSDVALSAQPSAGFGVQATRAAHTKCERCWLYRESARPMGEYSAVCQRCRQSVS